MFILLTSINNNTFILIQTYTSVNFVTEFVLKHDHDDYEWWMISDLLVWFCWSQTKHHGLTFLLIDFERYVTDAWWDGTIQSWRSSTIFKLHRVTFINKLKQVKNGNRSIMFKIRSTTKHSSLFRFDVCKQSINSKLGIY